MALKENNRKWRERKPRKFI